MEWDTIQPLMDSFLSTVSYFPFHVQRYALVILNKSFSESLNLCGAHSFTISKLMAQIRQPFP
jgi:hypothetical protein